MKTSLDSNRFSSQFTSENWHCTSRSSDLVEVWSCSSTDQTVSKSYFLNLSTCLTFPLSFSHFVLWFDRVKSARNDSLAKRCSMSITHVNFVSRLGVVRIQLENLLIIGQGLVQFIDFLVRFRPTNVRFQIRFVEFDRFRTRLNRRFVFFLDEWETKFRLRVEWSGRFTIFIRQAARFA